MGVWILLPRQLCIYLPKGRLKVSCRKPLLFFQIFQASHPKDCAEVPKSFRLISDPPRVKNASSSTLTLFYDFLFIALTCKP
jgi:hypothetical protein